MKNVWYKVHKNTKVHEILCDEAVASINKGFCVSLFGYHLIKADADGWIDWNAVGGTVNPLPDDCEFKAKFADGEVQDFVNYWDCTPKPDRRVVAYRPILNAEETEMNKEWSGEGLPPVGTHCKYRTGEDAYIVAHHMDGYQAIWSESRDGGELFYGTSDCFEPIRTDRDRWIDAALDCDCEPREGMLSRRDFCGALYDAGLAKLPEQTK